MQPDGDFLVLDPAYSEKPTADLSVIYWCSLHNRVLKILNAAAGQWGASIAEMTLSFAHQKICASSTPTMNLIPMPEPFIIRQISTIHVESEFIAAMVKKEITRLAPDVKWDIVPIAVSNEKGAKWLRISRGYQAADIRNSDGVSQIDLTQFPEPHKSRLMEQLLAANYRDAEGHVLEYKDARGHDDYADCLGLAYDVAFPGMQPAAPPPKLTNEPKPPVHGNLCFCSGCRQKREDAKNAGSDYGDSGGGSGIVCQ
jgi:hypothetical protein